MPGSFMASARLASVCCRTNSERVHSAQTFIEGIRHSRVRSGSVSRTPQEKLGRFDSQAGAVVDEGLYSRCALQSPRRWHEPSRRGVQA